MDNKALFKLSYGVFMLATKSGDTVNGCITNTCIQVANEPTRIAISAINTNYTCDLIKESGQFTLSLLSEDCTFDTIKRFGYQTGRTANKFEGLELPADSQGVPYLNFETCSVISGKVLEQYDLGSHTLFIAEVVDAFMVDGKNPLTYADYQDHVKPKPQAPKEEKKIVGWKCQICGYIYNEPELPGNFKCPVCGHSSDDFEPIYAS